MAVKNKPSFVGSWAFLLGVILAFIVGIFGLVAEGYQNREVFAIILVVLGLIVGLLNIRGQEVQSFLFAGAVLVIISSLGNDVLAFMPWLKNILLAILLMFVPATIIVAVKHVFSLAHK